MRHILTLPLHLLVTLRSAGVSAITGLRLGLPLVVAAPVDDLGVVTHHGAAVVHLGVALAALCGECLLALLDVGGVHHCLAHGPGHLALVLLGHLVALSVHLLLALGAARVASISRLSLGISLSLAISVTMGDNLGVMTNNSGAVVNLLGDRVAVLGDDVLALLDVGGVHNHVVLLVADLSLVLNGLLVALLVGLAEALEVVVFTISGLSLSLAISMTMRDNLGVMTNNSRAVVNLLGDRVAVLGDDVLALLGVGRVHDGVVLLVAALLVLDIVLGVTMGLVISILKVAPAISTIGDTSQTHSHRSKHQDS